MAETVEPAELTVEEEEEEQVVTTSALAVDPVSMAMEVVEEPEQDNLQGMGQLEQTQ